MPATTTLLGLVTPTQGTLSGTWGDTVNYGITDYVDIAVAGTLTLTGDGAVTLANTTGSSSGNSITSTLAGAGTVTAQFSAVRVSGTTTTKVVTGPSYSKTYLLDNASSYAVTFKASGQTGVSISPGEKVYVYYNATDYVKVGGGGITYGAVKTTTYTAVANDGVQTSTSGGAFTVNLPASPATGTQVFVVDSAGTWGTNNLTIGRNGSTIAGSATDLVCDINSVSIQCIYDGTTWDIFAQIGANNTAVLTQTNTVTGITNKTFVAPVLGAATATSLQGIIGNVTPAAGAFTTLTASSTLTVTGAGSIESLTVGRGAGAVASNTAVGASALASNSTGVNAVAIGYQALNSNTGGYATAVGSQAGKAFTLNASESFGSTFLGVVAGTATTTGYDNAFFGGYAGYANTTGSFTTATGAGALKSNTTASNNTAVGYQAGYTTSTGTGYNTFIGSGAGYGVTTGATNLCAGAFAGNALTTGSSNTFVGRGVAGAGELITTGSKNTVIGAYDGNKGGLDIRTSSNYIVLSDGDGNPYAQCNASFWKFGIGGTGSAYGGGSLSLNGSTASGYQTSITGYGNGTAYWTVGTKGAIDGSASTFLQCQNTGGGVYLNGASATSWTAVSDERLKENLVDITDAAAKVSTLRAVVGNYTWDEEKSRKPFLIAQDVQAVLPEAVSASRQIKGDETEYLGVSYTEVIPLLVAAIKELKAEIDTLKGNV